MAEPVARRTAVLSFHKIGAPPSGGWDTWNYIAADLFTAFLEYLRRECYHVLDLHGFLLGMEDPAGLPERSALLTFDDGYRSMLEVAQPILNRFGFPSVLFVPTDHVGGTNSWDQGIEPEEPICTWEELRELARRGVSVQSHGTSHRSFAGLDAASREYEVCTSKERLEERLGTVVEALAYPYGDNGRDVAALERALSGAGYRSAFLYKGGVAHLPTRTPYRLTRVPMGPDTVLADWLGGAA